MDSNRFDSWTRNRALRLSRRSALRLAGTGGVAAVLASATENTAAQSTCSLNFHAETAAGPSASKSYDGVLQFALGADGALTQASVSSTTGGAWPATGRATGRAIDIQITLPGNQTLTLSGVAERPLTTCQGVATGILSGPHPGDLGAWQATSGNAPITTSGQTSTNTNPPPSGPSCPAPSFACGPNCCPSGAACTDANQGICACPGSTTQCGLSCVPNCPDGQTLDLDTCTCASTCLGFQSPCNDNSQCCSGFCTDGECRTCGGINCGGKCIDTSVDPENCGGCGIVCSGNCVGGTCTAACLPDGSPCQSSSDCCSPGCNGTCGCARLGQSCNEDAGFHCCDGTPVICFGGACCILNNSPCSADADCCDYMQATGSCINGVCTRTA